jgi:hypothetical protein
MPPSKQWRETIVPGEEAEHERVAEFLRSLQRKSAKGEVTDRALHVKANAGLFAELRVRDDVPEVLRVGIFAKAATYRAYARYSNGAGARQHDRAGDVRALSVKVLGVPGKKLIPGLEGASTQDFLLIRTASLPARNSAEFGALVYAIQKPALIVFRLLGKVGLVRTFQILAKAAKGLGAPVMPLATTTYYSAAPIKWGDYAVKLLLVPRDPPPAAPPKRSSYTALGDELAERLTNGDVVYELRAQPYVDDTSTPIEDTTVEWTAAASPPLTVAELVIPKQDPASERGKKVAAFIETLSFDPWHAPVEFRPLGEVMRARNVAYRLSTMERKAAPEPDGSETFD